MEAAVTCPRCRTPLESDALPGFDVAMCPACTGVLVPQRKVIPLLESLSAELMASIDPDAPIEPAPDVDGDAACPSCAKTMDTFGYLGTKLVHLDRCRSCEVLWVDPDELTVMTVLHARTARRTGAVREMYEQWQEELSRRVSRMLKARAQANRIAGSSNFW